MANEKNFSKNIHEEGTYKEVVQKTTQDYGTVPHVSNLEGIQEQEEKENQRKS
ncbi:hypothetical protein [Bacillus alkalicellulosilyticus]|uniref:hypothetical protein n=1 Tax=Alkalihalobacterium alkalicellulosilyticum TaxID=1912214 RepID=UPI001482AFC3|nr:hypothetical protein [Bacillus alkalicellulosilyticus]